MYTARSQVLPVPMQVLTTLGSPDSGSFQPELAERTGLSRSTLSHVH